jgi:hypothetical protein
LRRQRVQDGVGGAGERGEAQPVVGGSGTHLGTQ